MTTLRRENTLLWLALFLACLMLISSGCLTPPPPRDQVVMPFTIHVVADMCAAGHPGFDGWQQGRELWVKWSGDVDIYGRPLPDFYMLGHEVWHLAECGGAWHGRWKRR